MLLLGRQVGRLPEYPIVQSYPERLFERKPRRIFTVLTNGKNRVRFLRNSGVILPRGQYRYFSLIAADERVRGVTLEGCKYPLKNKELNRVHQWAVSNEIVGNCALIEIRRGGAWVIESMD